MTSYLRIIKHEKANAVVNLPLVLADNPVFQASDHAFSKTITSIINTHNHIDHTRAQCWTVERYSVKRYVDNGFTSCSEVVGGDTLRDWFGHLMATLLQLVVFGRNADK